MAKFYYHILHCVEISLSTKSSEYTSCDSKTPGGEVRLSYFLKKEPGMALQ